MNNRGILWVMILVLTLICPVLAAMRGVQSTLNLMQRPEVVEEMQTVMTTEAIQSFGERTAEAEASTEEVKTGQVTNILLIGQDSREGEEAPLADTILLCTLNHDEKKLTLTSFLRDMYVQLPNYRGYVSGKNRINVNYALGYAKAGDLGGMEMTAQCIEENFGVRSDGIVVVGFEAFTKAVEAIGGIDVELDEAEAAYMTKNTGETYSAGRNQLNGSKALTYVRMRHSGPGDNDFYRTARQRKALESLLAKSRKMNVLEQDSLLKAVLPLIVTNMSSEQIIRLGIQLLPILGKLQVESAQCPAEGTYRGEMVDIMGISSGVLVPDVKKNRELIAAYAGS